jgi:hypothetical protein
MIEFEVVTPLFPGRKRSGVETAAEMEASIW